MYGQYRWEEIDLNKDVTMSNFEREGFGGLQEAAGEAGLSALDLFSLEPVETNIKARIPCSIKTTTSVQAVDHTVFSLPVKEIVSSIRVVLESIRTFALNNIMWKPERRQICLPLYRVVRTRPLFILWI